MGDEFDDLGFEADDSEDLGFTPQGYADARVMTLPTTEIVGDPTGGGGGSATESAEPVTVETQRRKEWVTDPTAAQPEAEQEPPGGDPRGLADRLRQYASGADPEALGTGWEVLGHALGTGGEVPTVGGREFPSLPSARRAAGAEDASGAVLAAMPADHSQTIVGTDQRPWAGAMGATDMASFGWLDDIAGAVGGDGRRDYERQASEQASEQAPTEYAMGQAAGSAPLALIPGAAPTAGARMAIAGGVGAGAGLLRGGGESDAEDVTGRLTDGVQQGALEGLMSAGTAGVAEGAAPLLGRLGERMSEALPGLRDRRTHSALEARGIWGNRAMQAAADRPGGQAGLAADLDELGLPLDARRTPRAIDRMLQESGPRIGQIREQVTASGETIDTSRIATRMRELADTEARAPVGGMQRSRALRQLADDIESAGPMPFDVAHQQRMTLDDMINRFSPDPNLSSVAGQRQTIRRYVSDEMGTAADAAGLGEDWAEANRTYSVGSFLDDYAQGGQRRNAQGGVAGAIAREGGVADILSGNPMGAVRALAGPAIQQEHRHLMPGMQVRALDRLIPMMERGGPQLQRAARVLRGAQQQGPAAVSAAHYTLARTSPEYRRAQDEAAEAAEETTE